MSLAFIVDMNLSNEWIPVFEEAGYTCTHWSTIGDINCPDSEIMAWAKANQRIVFTNDLDFGTLLALTKADGPSVIQIRGQDVMPEAVSAILLQAVRLYEPDLSKGALLTVDPPKSRIRILPI